MIRGISTGAVADNRSGVVGVYRVDVHARALTFNNRKDLSEELRLATELAGPLNFVGGVFFTDWDFGQYITNPTPGFDAAYTIPKFGYDSTALGVSRAQPVPAYQLHSIRLGLADHGWDASLYLNNALDAEVVTGNTSNVGERSRSLGQPRTAASGVYYNW